MSDVMELSLRGASNLEKLMRAVLLDSENKVPSERLRIVGALDEGAVIESGSNANGHYVRLADGTQICFADASISGSYDAVLYEPWRTTETSNVTYSASFINTPEVACWVFTPSAYSLVTRVISDSTSFYMLLLAAATVSFNGTCRYIAIGRWKA